MKFGRDFQALFIWRETMLYRQKSYHERRHSPLWEISAVREARKERNQTKRKYLFDKSEASKIKRRESSKQ